MLGPVFPAVKGYGPSAGRPAHGGRETAWRFRAGASWRDLPERFGNWNTIYENSGHWPEAGVWARVLEQVQAMAHQGGDGKGRALAFVLTCGQVADTTMLPGTLDEIRVAGATGRPRQRPDRLLADKGYPSRANRAWLRERGIATTIPERDDQIAHRCKRPGRPIHFGDEQRQRYRAATSSSAASASCGVGSRCDQTRPLATTTPVSASPPHSTGSRPLATRPNPIPEIVDN